LLVLQRVLQKAGSVAQSALLVCLGRDQPFPLSRGPNRSAAEPLRHPATAPHCPEHRRRLCIRSPARERGRCWRELPDDGGVGGDYASINMDGCDQSGVQSSPSQAPASLPQQAIDAPERRMLPTEQAGGGNGPATPPAVPDLCRPPALVGERPPAVGRPPATVSRSEFVGALNWTSHFKSTFLHFFRIWTAGVFVSRT
jgi:hypothetical protein